MNATQNHKRLEGVIRMPKYWPPEPSFDFTNRPILKFDKNESWAANPSLFFKRLDSIEIIKVFNQKKQIKFLGTKKNIIIFGPK